MSAIPPQSAVSNVWPRMAGAAIADPLIAASQPFGSSAPIGLPTVNNPNLPPHATSNFAPPIPQVPATPFPSLQQPIRPTNSLISSNYAIPGAGPPLNPFLTNVVCHLFKKLFIFLKNFNKRYQIQHKPFKMKLISDD